MPIPDFDDIANHLPRDGHAQPAELHRLACGILAAGFEPLQSQWLEQVSAYLDLPPDEPLTDNIGEQLLAELLQGSLAALKSGDFEFRLCLPDDDVYDLALRADSLARWCQGFLHGFAAIQVELSAENRELVSDLAEISRLESDSRTEDNEQEGYYADLTEFVRMAAISLFMDTRTHAAKPGHDHARH